MRASSPPKPKQKEPSILQQIISKIEALSPQDQNDIVHEIDKHFALKRYKEVIVAREVSDQKDGLFKQYISRNSDAERFLKEAEQKK